MGIFRSIETADGLLGWSYSGFSHFADLVRQEYDEQDDFAMDLDSFLDLAEGRINNELLKEEYRDWCSFDGLEEGQIPWEICEDAEPLLRKIVTNSPNIGDHKDIAIALCDKMKWCVENKTHLNK